MNIANFEAFWMEFKLVSKSFIWEVCDKYIQLLNQHYCHFGLLMAGALLPLKSALCLPYSVILITLFSPIFASLNVFRIIVIIFNLSVIA